ncbi:hypothetical protein LPJ81_001808 [Coemansia sp. IMI 209127]|nr:hypothetical protein LPJ81_001808 [Coemansia sp. IMI 209127]
MERKRRKKAAEAEAETTAAGSSVQQTENPLEAALPLVVKRRVIDDNDDGMDSDASEGKRRKAEQQSTPRKQTAIQSYATTPKVKNYVAIFERELEDLSLGLSGPLQNSPASDRISRANINDTYVDTDLSQLLGS